MKPGTRPAPGIAFPEMGRLGGVHPLPRNPTICQQRYCQARPEMSPVPPSLTLKQPTLPQSKRRKTGDPVLRHPQGIAENP